MFDSNSQQILSTLNSMVQAVNNLSQNISASFPQTIVVNGALSRVATNYAVTTNTTLANITGLTADLVAGRTYGFKASLFVNPDNTGGHKYAVGGTATATNIVYQINSVRNSTNAFVINSQQTAIGGSAGAAGGTAVYTEISGAITVNAAGTLTIQFAENASSGTSTVLAGSNLFVWDMT